MTDNKTNTEDMLQPDFTELIVKLWKSRCMIIKWGVIGAIVGLFLAFSIPKTYKASVTLAPEVEQKMGSGVSSIASMMGINLNNSVDAISVEMYPDVVHSTPFIYELFDLPVQFVRRDSTINTTLLDYMLNYQKYPWWSYVMSAPFKLVGWVMSIGKDAPMQEGALNPKNLPKKEREVVKFFSNNIAVLIDKKTSKLSMFIELQDPLVASDVMNAIVENLKRFMSDYRTSKARQDVENLSIICEQRKQDYQKAQQAYAAYVDANQNLSRKSAMVESERLQQEKNLAYQVYSQVAAQLEGSRIQEQQAKPVFVIIDPVVIPNRKAAPSKLKYMVGFAFLAGVCAVAWALFGKDYWGKLKKNI